jgi:hypothetical protein
MIINVLFLHNIQQRPISFWTYLSVFFVKKFQNHDNEHDHGCHNPSLGLVTKARACKIACQEWRKVWGNEPLHSQGNFPFKSWSPGGFANV